MPNMKIRRSFGYLWFVSVSVVEHLGLAERAYSLSGFAVSGKPIVVHLTFLLGYATNHHRSLLGTKRIVIDIDRCSRDVRAVLAITSTMHVETMAQRCPEFDVVPGHVTVAGPACACDRVPVPIEQVVLDHRRCGVMAYTIPKALILAVVYMIVMDMVPLGRD